MKKLLKFYLPLFLAISSLGFFTLRYLVVNHEPALKCAFGSGKIVSPAKKAVIKIDNIESIDAKIFELNGRFYLVTESIKDFDLLIVDKSANDVVLPNGNCQEVLFSNYLFLADCGFGGVFYSSAKTESFNTELKISYSDINFVVPNHKIEISFKGE